MITINPPPIMYGFIQQEDYGRLWFTGDVISPSMGESCKFEEDLRTSASKASHSSHSCEHEFRAFPCSNKCKNSDTVSHIAVIFSRNIPTKSCVSGATCLRKVGHPSVVSLETLLAKGSLDQVAVDASAARAEKWYINIYIL